MRTDESIHLIVFRERDSLDREVMELKKSNTVLEASLKSKIDELQEYQKEVSTCC